MNNQHISLCAVSGKYSILNKYGCDSETIISIIQTSTKKLKKIRISDSI